MCVYASIWKGLINLELFIIKNNKKNRAKERERTGEGEREKGGGEKITENREYKPKLALHFEIVYPTRIIFCWLSILKFWYYLNKYYLPAAAIYFAVIGSLQTSITYEMLSIKI